MRRIVSLLFCLVILTSVSYGSEKGIAGTGSLFPVTVHGKYGFIDSRGKMVIHPQFDDASPFSDGLARIKAGSSFGYIDTSGRIVIRPRFGAAGSFSEGLAQVHSGKRWAYIDRAGKVALEPDVAECWAFHEGLALARYGSLFGFLDRSGKMAIQAQIYIATGQPDEQYFSEGLANVSNYGVWGYIDRDGKVVLQPEVDEAWPFHEGLARVRVGGRFGFIDKSGKMVIGLKFEGADHFSEGLAPVRIGRKWGYIDRSGRVIIRPKYDAASRFSEGAARVEIGHEWAYVSKEERYLWNPAAPSLILPVLLANLHRPWPTGLYQLEQEMTFNVLDRVILNPESGQITLIGHLDERYLGPKIPYLQHLATLLENPAPQFSLNWTPESESRVDELFRRVESPEEVKNIVHELGRVFDENGKITAAGRWLLPLLGVKTLPGGNAPGDLGATISFDHNGKMRVEEVAAGSPARRAGLQVEDEILTVNGQAPVHLSELTRLIRFAGAGGMLEMQVSRQGAQLPATATLSAAAGDLWDFADAWDLTSMILRATGNEEGAALLSHHGVLARVSRLTDSDAKRATSSAMMAIMAAAGNMELWQGLEAQIRNGETTRSRANGILWGSILEEMEKVLPLRPGSATGVFQRSLDQGMDLYSALHATYREIRRQIPSILESALETHFGRHEEAQVPPAVIDWILGAHPEATPDYRGVDRRSQLARVMFDSDFVGKHLMSLPDVQEAIPGYQTEFAFRHAHPGNDRPPGTASIQRLWISVQKLDLAQSPDGYTLATRDAKMRFHLREKGAEGRDPPPEPGGYEDLLTSLYDDLAVEFPVLHELRECAKLTAAAQWMKARKPDLKLPAAGRITWNGPTRVSGAVYMTWAPRFKEDAVSASMAAKGGVSLIPPVGPGGQVEAPPIMKIIQADPSLADLRESKLTAVPEPGTYNDESLRKSLRLLAPPPEPQLVGWAVRGARGERSLKAVTVVPVSEECDVVEAFQLRDRLEEAKAIAFQLRMAEAIISHISRRDLIEPEAPQNLTNRQIRKKSSGVRPEDSVPREFKDLLDLADLEDLGDPAKGGAAKGGAEDPDRQRGAAKGGTERPNRGRTEWPDGGVSEEYDRLKMEIEEAMNEKRENLVEFVESLLLSFPAFAKEQGWLRHLNLPVELTGTQGEVRSFEAFETAWKMLRGLRESGDSEQVMNALRLIFQGASKRDSLENPARDALGRIVKPLEAVLYHSKRVADLLDSTHRLYEIARNLASLRPGRNVASAVRRRDEEQVMLREQLLPLEKELSRKLQEALADPVVKRWMEGQQIRCR